MAGAGQLQIGDGDAVHQATSLPGRWSLLYQRFGEPALSPMQVSRVREYIRVHLASDLGLAEMAGQVNLSPHYFSMLFKHAVGVSPYHYVLQERIREAQRLLAVGGMSISELALNLGFSDQSHFSRAFRRMTGTTPKRYQSNVGIRRRLAPAAVERA